MHKICLHQSEPPAKPVVLIALTLYLQEYLGQENQVLYLIQWLQNMAFEEKNIFGISCTDSNAFCGQSSAGDGIELHWVTDEEPTYTKWAPGQPYDSTENYVVMYRIVNLYGKDNLPGFWNDLENEGDAGILGSSSAEMKASERKKNRWGLKKTRTNIRFFLRFSMFYDILCV